MSIILLTGSTGFLGSHLLRKLQIKGHSLVALKRKNSSLERISDLIKKTTFCDVDSINFSFELFNKLKPDVIIHCATHYGHCKSEVNDVYEANKVFPMELLKAASKFGLKSFFNIDTYFNVPGRESSYLEDYVLSKKQFLQEGMQYSKEVGIQFINFKLEHLYGPGDRNEKFIPWLIESCVAGAFEIKLTAGEQLRDFIYVSDAVDAIALALEKRSHFHPQFEEISLGTGTATSIKDFALLVQRLTKSRASLCFGELPYREYELMSSKAENQKLLELGWRPLIPLEFGILKILSCMDKHPNGAS